MTKIIYNDEFAEKSQKALQGIVKSFESLPKVRFEEFAPENTVIVNVDIINGFCKKGNLSSDLVLKIVPYAALINKKFQDYEKVFFVDRHIEASEEFKAYVPHCIEGTEECEIVDELKPLVDDRSTVCYKNSVNGFLCDDYQKWFKNNMDKTNIIVLGDVTDICVLNYCLSQKTFFNEKNISSRIIIPIKGIETFDLDITNHYSQLMNLFSIYNMKMNGIEIVEDFE